MDPLNGQERCECAQCIDLRNGYRAATAAQTDGRVSAEERSTASVAVVALLSVLNTLHRLHRPEWYVWQAHNAPARWSHLALPALQKNAAKREYDDDNVPANGTGERFYGKFMVCDHCRGHGLPCNEAPVCDQCQMSGTACIHRLCDLSPASKDACPREECRYAHNDYLPVPFKPYRVGDYIVLHGNLRGYLVDGRVARQEWADHDITDWREFDRGVIARRRRAWGDLARWVREGQGTWESLSHYCGASCGKLIETAESPAY